MIAPSAAKTSAAGLLLIALAMPLLHAADAPAKASKPAGIFRVEYDTAPSTDHAEFQEALQKERVFEDIAAELNRELVLPFDISIQLGECGEENAFYMPEQRALIVCYELVDHFVELFAPAAGTEEELGKAAMDATMFVFFHELGHALIHALDVPVTGREEDAVDDLAAVSLIEAGKEGEEMVLDAATWFLLQGLETRRFKDLAFWDEHGLDLQRFYNMACLVYGKDPKGHADIVTDGILPEERAERCADEYAQKHKSWEKLLGPHKRPAKADKTK